MATKFRILLLSATPFEIEPTVVWLRARATYEQENILQFSSVEVEVLFTGVGLAASAYTLGKRFAAGPLPDMAIQAGIAGAIDRQLELGGVYQVTAECFGDSGAEAADGSWLSLGDLGFHPGPPHDKDELLQLLDPAQTTPFPSVAGLTVAQTTGTETGLQRLKQRWPAAQVETMEGAPFFRACLEANLNPVSLRSISNYVEARNRENWKLRDSIEALNDGLQQLLTPFLSQ